MAGQGVSRRLWPLPQLPEAWPTLWLCVGWLRQDAPPLGAFAAFLLGCCAMLQYHHSCVGTACVYHLVLGNRTSVYLLPEALLPPISLPSNDVLLNSFCIIICWFLQGWADSCHPGHFPTGFPSGPEGCQRSLGPSQGPLTARPCEVTHSLPEASHAPAAALAAVISPGGAQVSLSLSIPCGLRIFTWGVLMNRPRGEPASLVV